MAKVVGGWGGSGTRGRDGKEAGAGETSGWIRMHLHEQALPLKLKPKASVRRTKKYSWGVEPCGMVRNRKGDPGPKTQTVPGSFQLAWGVWGSTTSEEHESISPTMPSATGPWATVQTPRSVSARLPAAGGRAASTVGLSRGTLRSTRPSLGMNRGSVSLQWDLEGELPGRVANLVFSFWRRVRPVCRVAARFYVPACEACSSVTHVLSNTCFHHSRPTGCVVGSHCGLSLPFSDD